MYRLWSDWELTEWPHFIKATVATIWEEADMYTGYKLFPDISSVREVTEETMLGAPAESELPSQLAEKENEMLAVVIVVNMTQEKRRKESFLLSPPLIFLFSLFFFFGIPVSGQCAMQ